MLEIKWEQNEAVHYLVIDLNKGYVSVRREVLYNILIEFGFPPETGKANENVSETYSTVRVDQY
jgi:hypothetical protein